jgi:DNA-binding response OmpR family regulator
MKIVLLDDDRETYEVLQEVAKLSGSEIIYFNDLKEAKEFIKDATDIDGIVAEKRVGGLPTWDILSYLKKTGKLKEIPFIVLSKELAPEEKEFFEYMGATAILEKPFNPLEVFLDIVEHLRQYKGEDYVRSRLQGEEILKKKLSTEQQSENVSSQSETKQETQHKSGLLSILEKFIEFFKHFFAKK